MKKFVTALAVATALVLFAQDAQAFGKRKCNTCQTTTTCQFPPTTCQTVVTVQATQPAPTVIYSPPTVIYYAAPNNWQPLDWQSSSCPNGRCPNR